MINFIIKIEQSLINFLQLSYFLLYQPLLCLFLLLFLPLYNDHLGFIGVGAHLSLQMIKDCEGFCGVHQAVMRVRAFFLQLLL